MKWRLCGLVFLFSTSTLWATTYQTFEENGKVGIKDDAGHVVLPPAFDALGWSDGHFSVVGETTGYRQQGLWGLINLKKEIITPPLFEDLTYASGDCLVARKKISPAFAKAGCVGLKGEIKIPFVYDGIMIHGLRAVVFTLSNGRYRYGLTDLSHHVLVPVEYNDIRPLGTLRYAVQNAQKKIALFSEEGTAITDFSIDSISDFYKNYAILYRAQQQGLMHRDGTMRLDLKYSAIRVTPDAHVVAKLPAAWLLINSKNQVVQEILADEFHPLPNGFLVRRGDAFGFVNKNLTPVLDVRYARLQQTVNGNFLARLHAKEGVLSADGKEVIPFWYDSLVDEGVGYRSYTRGLGWQWLHPSGKVLTGRYFEQLFPKNEWGLPAKSKGYFGLVNFKGVEQVACVFDSVSAPVDGYLVVKFKGNYSLIDAREDWLVAPQPFPVLPGNAKLYVEKHPDNYFVKSLTGALVYFTPNRLRFDRDGFIEIFDNGSEKRFDNNGQLVSPLAVGTVVATDFFPEREGLRGIRKDDRYGFVDNMGRLRIANRYDSIGAFHEGLAGVKLIGRWGFVNAQDQIVINPNFDQLADFVHGLAIVCRNKKYGLIDQKGQAILAMRYDRIQRLHDNRFVLLTGGRQGLADERGNVTVEPRFDSLIMAEDHMLIACQDGKWGVISDLGLNIIPMIYDRLMFDPVNKYFLAKRETVWQEIEMK